jgi:hypothetical protein
MADCELFAECAFFKKHAKTHVAASHWMIAEYCRGSKQSECKRKQHLVKYEEPPPENMLPGGSIIRLDAQIFCQDSDTTNLKNAIEDGPHLEEPDKYGTPLTKDHPLK